MMDAIWALLFGALAVAIAALWGNKAGRSKERQRAATEARNRATATQARMDDVFANHVGDDPAVNRDFLRERGKS